MFYGFGTDPWLTLLYVLAMFTVIGAFSAFMRTGPALSFLYREPKQLAPTERPQAPSGARRLYRWQRPASHRRLWLMKRRR